MCLKSMFAAHGHANLMVGAKFIENYKLTPNMDLSMMFLILVA